MRYKKNKYRFNLPRQTGKEKNVAGQAASCAHNEFSGHCGGFDYIEAAVPYAPDKGVTPIR